MSLLLFSLSYRGRSLPLLSLFTGYSDVSALIVVSEFSPNSPLSPLQDVGHSEDSREELQKWYIGDLDEVSYAPSEKLPVAVWDVLGVVLGPCITCLASRRRGWAIANEKKS